MSNSRGDTGTPVEKSPDSDTETSKQNVAPMAQEDIVKMKSELIQMGWRNSFRVALLHFRFRLGLYKSYDSRVQKIGSTIVKWASRTRPAEALAMEFVRRNTNVPVPRVVEVLTKADQTYIIMEYVRGTMLASVWSELAEGQKADIMKQLKEYLEELRALQPSSPGRVEAVDGTACFDARIGGDLGPFDSVEAFQERLGYKYIRNSADKYPSFQDAFRRVDGKDYRTTFTHGDLCLHNILVCDAKIVAIIDWEFAGWYPEYWEYTQGIPSNSRYPEFKEMWKRGNVIEQYPDELETETLLASVFTRV